MPRLSRPLAFGAGAAAAALAAGAMLALPSAAQPTVTAGGLPDLGTITLRTGSTTGLAYAPGPDSTVPAATQAIRSSGSAPCNATTPGFLAVTGVKSGTPACFGTLGFGDGPGGEPWFHLRPNADAAQGEALALSLAGPLAGAEFASFSLDLELAAASPAGGVDLVVEVRDSASPSDPPLQTINVDLSPANRVPNVSLPNYRVVVADIAAPGNQLVLRPQGSVRLQLEGDTQNLGSVFTVTDITDVVPCEGGTAESSGATFTVEGGEGCTSEAVFFAFDREANTVKLLKDPSDSTFRLTIPWDAETAAYPVPATTIDYFDGGGDTVMVGCAGTTLDPTLPGDQIASTPEVDGWCVAGQSFELVGGGQMQVTETLYGVADPAFGRLAN